MASAVLVVGVARPLGARIAEILLAEPSVDQVVGVDVAPPEAELPGVKFVPADLTAAGAPVLLEALRDFEIDTVVHMGLVSHSGGPGGRVTAKELNVLGTMQLLGACQRAQKVRRLVVKSSGAVYGSSPRDPAMFTEAMEAREPLRPGFGRDSLEVEGYVRGFARRRPDVSVTTFRMANVVGPSEDSPLTTYLTLPVWPTPLGRDARIQLLHEDDALEVLRLTTLREEVGAPTMATYNVAGAGILLLSQAARRAGRPTVPVPAPIGGWVGAAFRRAGIADFASDQMRYLSYGRVLDCTRLAQDLGFVPIHSTADTFAAFLAGQGLTPLVPEGLVDHLVDAVVAIPEVASWLDERERRRSG